MKKRIKQLLYSLGYEICKLDSRVEIDCAWGPNVLLFALNELASSTQEKLKIVQIGANDGGNQDPLVPFLQSHDCDAILIEPMDQPYAALAERYSNSRHVQSLQAAIGDSAGVMDMYYIVDASGEPDLTLYSSLDHAKVARILAGRIKQTCYKHHSIRSKQVEIRTLGSVLDEFGFSEVDVVVVDVEGFDHRIVSNFLSQGIEPKIIRFEYCNMTKRNFHELRSLLLAKEYELVRVGIDIYCQKKGLLR